MGRSGLVVLGVIVFLMSVSGARVPKQLSIVNVNNSEKELLKKLLEDGETELPPFPSDVEYEIACEQAMLRKLSDVAERVDEDILMDAVVDIERMVAGLSEEEGVKMNVLASAVVGPIVTEVEKERGLRVRGVGPKPLKTWLDSSVGEARRIVWSVGPQVEGGGGKDER